MWYWNHDFGWGWVGAVVTIVMVALFWGVVVAGVIVLLRRFGRPGDGSARDADTILDERFARGEIDEEELERRRTALHSRS